MKSLKYILSVFASFLLASCFSDKSTDAYLPISDIVIESGIDTLYNINKNDVIKISPVVSQTIEGKELKYIWEMELKEVSYDKEFVYVGNELGARNCRLIIENEDGRTYFPFTIYVNSPYEEGLTIVSKDKDGNSLMSFMLNPNVAGVKGEFMDENCFAVNNENIRFASNVSDIVQTTGSLVIACQGSEEEGDGATIYFLNDKTFVVENFVTTSEYPSFKPTKLLIPTYSEPGVSYPVLSVDGKIYDLPTYDAVIQPSTKYSFTYSQSCFVAAETSRLVDIMLWDNVNKGLSLMYNGYGPYYFGDAYLMTLEGNQDEEEGQIYDYATSNYFKNIKSFLAMAEIRRTYEQKLKSNREMLVLVKGEDIDKLVIQTFPWALKEGTYDQYKIMDNGGFKLAGASSPINENTPCIANKTYLSLLFGDGNKVRRWYFTQTKHVNKAETLLTVGSDDAVITGFEMSEDHLKTYVAFYEPNSDKELNGSVWVFDTDKGTVLEEYNNVCYQPVKMIYKKK